MRHRPAAVLLLLASCTLQACYRDVEIADPRPGEPLTRVVLEGGEVVHVLTEQRATIEDSVVVLRSRRRDRAVLRTIPLSDVETMSAQRLDPGGTTLVVLIAGGAAVLFMSAALEGGYSE